MVMTWALFFLGFTTLVGFDVMSLKYFMCVCGSFGCWKLTALTSGSRDDSERVFPIETLS